MRITCPNCLAQYEIDASLLPVDGREVQCSSCDTIWFQTAPTRKAAKPVAPSPKAAPTFDLQLNDDADGDAPQPPAPDSRDAAENDQTPRPRPRALDPSVTEVLRKEAEFEAAQRQRDADPVEVQSDLGLLGGNPWPAFRDPDSEPGINQPRSESGPANTSSFPNIDDVGASLDPIGTARQSETGGYELPLTARDRQRGFLQGFIIPVAIGALLVGLYMAAPLLSSLVPPAAPILAGYTDAIDNGRVALATMILGR